MRVKTSDLQGAALDWAVAKCEGIDVQVHSVAMILERRLKHLTQKEAATLPAPKPYLVIPGVGNAQYSTAWSQGGPIIERAEIGVKRRAPCMPDEQWEASPSITAKGAGGEYGRGPTPLIAAMRCYVASKLGKEVEVPEDVNH